MRALGRCVWVGRIGSAPEVVLPIPILYEDNHCMAVAKPAGMLVQADRTGDPTILDAARDDLRQRLGKPGNVFLAAVHRLDRPVSGVLLLARTSKAATRLSAQFRSGSIEKTYLALVERAPAAAEGTFEDLLVKVPGANRVRVVRTGEAGARAARLGYRIVSQHAGGTLLEVRLETGRSHQIRVQFAARGCPIVGDLRYGSRRALGSMIGLHASVLVFQPPTRSERVEVRAPLPPEWDALLGG
jgi:23S rRNA pseudouridine1911/1915/1917 synthase